MKKKKQKANIRRRTSDAADIFQDEMPGVNSHASKEKQERMRHRKHKKKCMLYPEDTQKVRWDLFITLILFISCINTPYRIAFGELKDPL